MPASHLDSTRRRFLSAAGLAATALGAACAPAAAPSTPASAPAATPPAWQKEWDDLVAAAKKEGTLALVTSVGEGYKKAVAAFEEAFPGIKVEQTSLIATQFAPRAFQEMQAGVFAYDAITTSHYQSGQSLYVNGRMAPLKPLVFRPDVMDDKVWKDGFPAGFVDRDKQFAYAGFVAKSRFLWINTDLVKEGEITTAQDLTNPKWKGGKILTGDPRVNGAGSVPASDLRAAFGDDLMKKIWKDQEPVLSRDNRQMAEFMVRGRYPIGIGTPGENILPEFLAQGLGKQLKYVEGEGMDQGSSGQDVLYYFDKAPHPNAAKLFINWFLTKEGQSVWAKYAPNNSRRADVAPGLPDSVAAPGKKYLVGDSWENKDLIPEVQKLARQLLD